jgi:hypothetical protein
LTTGSIKIRVNDMTTIFDGSKQDLLDAVASGHVTAEDAFDEFAVRHAEGKEGYEEYAPAEGPANVGGDPVGTGGVDQGEHDAPEVEYAGGDAEPA